MLTKNNALKGEIRTEVRGGPGSMTFTPKAEVLPDSLRLVSEILIPPGAGIGVHTHDGETEIYYIVRGTGVVTDDGVEKPIGPGDVMVTPNGHNHSVTNNGTEDLLFLAVINYDINK